MGKKGLCLFLAMGFLMPSAVAAQTPGADPEVAKGIRQVDDGDYDAAILTLDAAARRLAPDPKRTRELSEAYLYLGIAYLGKGHEAAARAKFREAVKSVRDLNLSPDKFSPRVIEFVEAAKQEAGPSSPAGPAAPAKAVSPAAPEPAKKGGSGKTVLFVVLGAVVAGGVILAVSKSGGSEPTCLGRAGLRPCE